jgi:hypothetical protein
VFRGGTHDIREISSRGMDNPWSVWRAILQYGPEKICAWTSSRKPSLTRLGRRAYFAKIRLGMIAVPSLGSGSGPVHVPSG